MKHSLACCICVWAAGCVHNEPAHKFIEGCQQDKDTYSVSVESLQHQLPTGHLGVPLGTVVRVTGEAVDGKTHGRPKWDRGTTFLQIATVNGRKLEKPVLFAFFRAPDSVKEPAPGEQFDYYVHEFGEWDGVVEPPEELGIQKLGLAHDGFHYRRRLTIHASNAVPIR